MKRMIFKPVSLQLYDSVSFDSLNYMTFKSLVLKRFRLLKRVEEAKVDFKDFGLSGEEDVLSHCCLKLVCAQMDHSAEWFNRMEVKLFNMKNRIREDEELMRAFGSKIIKRIQLRKGGNLYFMEAGTKINEENLQNENLFDLQDEGGILGSESSLIENPGGESISPTRFLELVEKNELFVHFTKVIDLVGSRKIIPEQGYVLFSPKIIHSLLSTLYRDLLSRRMRRLKNKVKIYPDERLTRIHEDIFQVSRPTISSTLSIAEKFFPPCISQILSKFRAKRHIKYNDRQILTRFLKDAGISLNETTQLFRSLFNCSADVFDKEYLYSIRHNYGQEGKRANYTSYSCSAIIGFSNSKDTYGCPMVKNTNFLKEKYTEFNIEDLLSNSHTETCTNILNRITKETLPTVKTPIAFYKKNKNFHEKNKENENAEEEK